MVLVNKFFYFKSKLIQNFISPAPLLQTINREIMNTKFFFLLNYLRSFKFSKIKAIVFYFILFMSIFYIYYVLFNILYHIYTLENYFDFMCNMTSNSSTPNPQDPIRYWPSGVPQAWSVIAASLATFIALRKTGVNPKVGGAFALSAGLVSASVVTIQSIIENPVGFTTFLKAVGSLKNNGSLPSISEVEAMPQATSTESEVIAKWVEESMRNNKEFATKVANMSDPEVSELIAKVKEAWDSHSTGNSFLSNSNTIVEKIMQFYQSIYQATINNIKIEYPEGYLCEIIGQRIFFEFIIFITLLAIIYLFFSFLFNLLILLNKDKILNFFTNKYVLLLVRYEIMLSKFIVYVTPILILFALLNILFVSF